MGCDQQAARRARAAADRARRQAMSRTAVLVCTAAIAMVSHLLFMPSLAQTLNEQEGEIIAIQKEWADARVQADIPYLERLYADEFRVQTMNGSVASREDDIAMFREGTIKPESIRHEDINVSFYGDVALVTGIENVAGTAFGGPRAEFSLRFTNVFVHRDGHWQLVLHQSTAIPRQQ